MGTVPKVPKKCFTDLKLFRIVDEGREHDDAEHQEEDEEGQLLRGGLERVNEDLETRWVASELEQPQDPDDGEELEDVWLVYVVGDAVLQEDVRVEAQGGDEVYHVHRWLDELDQVGTNLGTEGARSVILAMPMLK